MGFLGSLLGKEKESEYPALDANNPAARRLEKSRADLEAFAGKVSDKLEFIPTEKAVYCFVGKPPDAFGIVWWSDGQEHNFKTLMQERGLNQQQVQIFSDKLRDAYEREMSAPRFSVLLAGRSVKVAPDDALSQDVSRIIGELEHGS